MCHVTIKMENQSHVPSGIKGHEHLRCIEAGRGLKDRRIDE